MLLSHKNLFKTGSNQTLCSWLLEFLSVRPQAVRAENNTSNTTSILIHFLFPLLTYDCTPKHSSNFFVKFVDDATVVGLFSSRV